MSCSVREAAAQSAIRPHVPPSVLRTLGLLLGGAALLAATAVRADPCEGRLPERPGERFGGLVRYVGDGDSLCVGSGRDPARWIEVRLADHDAPELRDRGGPAARDRLSRLVMGRRLDCEAVRGRNGRVRSYDRVIARCRLEGRPLGDLLRRP